MMNYIKIASLVSLFGVGAYFMSLRSAYVELQKDNAILEAQIETHSVNLEMLTELLENERATTETARFALEALREDVPNEVLTEELPTDIQRVIDDFHNGIRN